MFNLKSLLSKIQVCQNKQLNVLLRITVFYQLQVSDTNAAHGLVFFFLFYLLISISEKQNNFDFG